MNQGKLSAMEVALIIKVVIYSLKARSLKLILDKTRNRVKYFNNQAHYRFAKK